MFLKKIVQPFLTQIRCCHLEKNVLSLSERGFFRDLFPDDAEPKMRKLFVTEPQTIYAGFDPTADSLHIGNLLVIMGLIHCQRGGHQPIALLGGATGQIGDPTGRKTERNLMDASSIEINLNSIKRQIETLFDNHERYYWRKNSTLPELKKIMVVNNADWYKKINFVDFIANMGRHFRLSKMLSLSSVQTRLQSDGMTFTEFTYQVFQAYDWLHLCKTHNCLFQLGGSDQMGNLMTGHELISRVVEKPVYGLTLPIITNEEGNKFGKSAGNAVWLDEEKTSVFSFYQFFFRVADSEVENLLKLLTLLPLKEINEIMKNHRQIPELREAQRRLAKEVTLLVHGEFEERRKKVDAFASQLKPEPLFILETGLEKAETVSSALYKGNVETVGKLNRKEIKETFAGATMCDILQEPGITVLELAMKCKCFATENDAIRIIRAGGFSINQNKTQNIAEVISPSVHMLENDSLGVSFFPFMAFMKYYVATLQSSNTFLALKCWFWGIPKLDLNSRKKYFLHRRMVKYIRKLQRKFDDVVAIWTNTFGKPIFFQFYNFNDVMD